MKTYFTKIIFKKSTIYRAAIVEVYRIKHNMPHFIGEEKFNTGSWKGEQGSAMDILYKVCEISKKQYGTGYYDRSNGKFQLQSI